MQTPLLPAQGEHLHAKGPVYTFCLQPLPNGQSLLGEFLTLRKATVQQGPHCLHCRCHVEMVKVRQLLREPGVGSKVDVQCLDISKLVQSLNTPAMALHNHLAIASLLGQTHDLGSVRQELCDFLRLPLEGVETQVQHGYKCWRVSKTTSNRNALVWQLRRAIAVLWWPTADACSCLSVKASALAKPASTLARSALSVSGSACNASSRRGTAGSPGSPGRHRASWKPMAARASTSGAPSVR